MNPIATLAVAACLAAEIDTVEVGNPGNAPDRRTVFFNGQPDVNLGSVAQPYRIATFEVTNAQYAEFLNAKAATSDPSELYNPQMTTSANGGITRAGSGTAASPFAYATKNNYADRPVNFVSFYDSIRFANWLHNGQGSASTETGSYTLPSTDPIPAGGDSITRNPDATWALPSEDQWYKAAYHQPASQGGDSDSYWTYATQSNTVPDVDNPDTLNVPDPTNVANYFRDDTIANGFNDGYAINPNGDLSDLHVTPVGSYSQADSFYGTFDQTGNVHEWTDTAIVQNPGQVNEFTLRIIEGGSWTALAGRQSAGFRTEPDLPGAEEPDIGFRLALVPEPTTAALLILPLTVLLSPRRPRRET